MKSIEDKGCCNYGPGQDNSTINASSFEFHKGSIANKASNHRMVLGSLSKSTPSKWDDAQKWLVGLSSGGDPNHANCRPRISNAEDPRLIGSVPPRGKDSCSNPEEIADCRGPEIMNQDEGETKKMDCNKSFWRINKPVEDTFSAVQSVCVRDMGTEMTPIASQEPSRTGTPLRATTPVVRSPVSSRSSSPGRCHQGAQAFESHQMGGSSVESRSDAVLFGRTNSIGWPTRGSDAFNIVEKNNLEQARKPNSLETRAIAWDEAERAKYMARMDGYLFKYAFETIWELKPLEWEMLFQYSPLNLPSQLNVDSSLERETWKSVSPQHEFLISVLPQYHMAEQGNFLFCQNDSNHFHFRYKREEVKIEAWENHEKRKAEMKMRRMEVKAERLKSRAQERLTNKLAATRRIAEEKRANAAAKMNEQAVRTSERADYIRRTGHLPSSFFTFKLPSCCW